MTWFDEELPLDTIDGLLPVDDPKWILVKGWQEDPVKFQSETLLKMGQCNQHTFFLLTDKPKLYTLLTFPENVWLGTIVHRQKEEVRMNDLKFLPVNNPKFILFEPQEPILTTFEEFEWVIIGADENGTEESFVEVLVHSTFNMEIPLYLREDLKDIWNCIMYDEKPEV